MLVKAYYGTAKIPHPLHLCNFVKKLLIFPFIALILALQTIRLG